MLIDECKCSIRRGVEIDGWDLATFKHRFRYKWNSPSSMSWHKFSDEGRRLVLWSTPWDHWASRCDVEVIDTAYPENEVWSFTTPSIRLRDGLQVSPDGAVCAVNRQDHVTVIDMLSGQVLWERPCGECVYFTPDGGVFVSASNGKPFEYLNARTGLSRTDELRTYSMDAGGAFSDYNMFSNNHVPRRYGSNSDRYLPPPGRHILLDVKKTRFHEPTGLESWLENRWPRVLGYNSPTSIVMERVAGRVLFCLSGGGDDSGIVDEFSRLLSEDGSTLVTFNRALDLDTIRIYDVHSARAWALGDRRRPWLGSRVAVRHTGRFSLCEKAWPGGEGAAAGRVLWALNGDDAQKSLAYPAVQPPSTVRIWPVHVAILPDRARNRAATAISSVVPGRPSGTWSSIRCTCSRNWPPSA